MMSLRRLLLLLTVLLLLCGCSRMAEGEYQVITEHVETSPNPETTDRYYEVHTYSGLKRAVQDLVSSSAEDGVIRTVEYNGVIRDDISKVCLEVTRSTPLGAYAVDYMTHSVSRILSYDEISLHIHYKLSQEEMSAVRSVSSMNDFWLRIDEGLDSGTEFLALQIVTLGVTDRSIKNYILNYYQQHPDTLLSLPDVSVAFYPSEEYVQKIITLNLDFHTSHEDREAMLIQLRQRAHEIAHGVNPSRQEESAMLCCMAVAGQLNRLYTRGRTAYDVLINHSGNSEGCAMAYQLLCTMCGVPCQVVSGRLNSETHYWNLIQLGKDYYHVDCSACIGQDLADGFLKRDSDLWGSYWWEAEHYPSAQGSLTADKLQKQYLTPEPVPSGSPFITYID
jgi:hypothetical protein